MTDAATRPIIVGGLREFLPFDYFTVYAIQALYLVRSHSRVSNMQILRPNGAFYAIFSNKMTSFEEFAAGVW